jgi:hypothetical protein
MTTVGAAAGTPAVEACKMPHGTDHTGPHLGVARSAQKWTL